LQIIKSNPAFEVLRERTQNYFSRSDLHFSSDSHLCFVCGAGGETLPDSTERSLRSLYVEHVRASIDEKIVCVRAEAAVTEFSRQLEERGINISEFEKTIAETVDSILIFPESPGSFAELGYFSADISIAKKILVAVKQQHQSGSFLMLGPIRLISKNSIFGPIPIALGQIPETQMQVISERLIGESKRKRPYKRRFELKKWKDYSRQETLCILDEIVDLAEVITEPDLLQLVLDIFGYYDATQIRLQLALLTATDRVLRNDFGDIFARKRSNGLIGISNKMERLALCAKWHEFYQVHMPEALEELARL